MRSKPGRLGVGLRRALTQELNGIGQAFVDSPADRLLKSSLSTSNSHRSYSPDERCVEVEDAG